MDKALAGVILCGGGSRRMGRDKALLQFGGEPLVDRVVRRVRAAADPVLLAPGRAGRVRCAGCREVEDAVPDAGPLSGVVAALRSSPHELTAAVAVDLPFASAGVLRLLAGVHAHEDAVVPATEHGLEPLHAVYARSALQHLEEALAGRRLALMEALRPLRLRVVGPGQWRTADPSGRFALNLNTPEDLHALAP